LILIFNFKQLKLTLPVWEDQQDFYKSFKTILSIITKRFSLVKLFLERHFKPMCKSNVIFLFIAMIIRFNAKELSIMLYLERQNLYKFLTGLNRSTFLGTFINNSQEIGHSVFTFHFLHQWAFWESTFNSISATKLLSTLRLLLQEQFH